MKKIFILIATFFCSNVCLCQAIELIGKFRYSGETIEFVEKDSFYYNNLPNCEESFYGKGTCIVKNNLLYLNFENTKNKHPQFFESQIIKTKSKGDSSLISFNCKRENGENLIGMSLIIKNRKIGVPTDLNGNAKLKISNDLFPIIIKTSYLEIDSKEIKLDSIANYNVRLIFKLNVGFTKKINNGESYIYEIEDLSESMLRIRLKNSKGEFFNYIKWNH